MKQKIKILFSDSSWLILPLALVIIVSFCLKSTENHFLNKPTVLSAQTIETSHQIVSKEKITQVSNFLKKGYVGDYYVKNISYQKPEISLENITTPQVLGIKTVRKPYRAELVKKSYQVINIAPGKRITFEAEFKNTGTETWFNSTSQFIALNVTDPTGRKSALRDVFWPKYYRPTIMKTKVVKPGEIGLFRFALTAPSKEAIYTEKFGLVAENLTWLEGGNLTVSMNVGIFPKAVTEIKDEPNIRVGLYSTTSEIKITANGTYKVKDTENKLIGTYVKEVVSTVTYTEGIYTLSVNGETTKSDLPFRFIPKSKQTILEITNYENKAAWNQTINDNRFRGNLEIHFAKESDRLWVINELPLESYLRGIAEAGNDNDIDYLKALMIAARTYAMYHIQTNTKHADENFTVDAAFDQVYRGYGFELRAPLITQAILNTTGKMVIYNKEVVVTPYFSQTDGRTRSWEEVWSGGPYPWLVSVPDPACSGRELLGHGVGMSAYGARAMAEQGKSYKEILKYYYTGIEIKKFY